MDLRHYEHIVALAENGNFRKAAETVHISTPALTKSIQKSEAFFDVKLFDRTRSGITPTPFGDVIVRKARILLKEAGEISSDVKSLMRMDSGHGPGGMRDLCRGNAHGQRSESVPAEIPRNPREGQNYGPGGHGSNAYG